MANDPLDPNAGPLPPAGSSHPERAAAQAELPDFPDPLSLSQSDPTADTSLPFPGVALPEATHVPDQGAIPPPAWNAPEPIPQLSDFRIIRKLGEGAVGVVYKAYQISAARKVAVKVVFPHLARNPKILERFYREARAMGLMDHPNIVQAFAVGEENGCHYFAMEYVHGSSLFKWLLRLGTLPVGDAVNIAIACAKALEHAHSLGLVHRDVKPENVLITRSGQVKLTDFGMVKVDGEAVSLTQTGHAVGTPTYMPLEQARNSKESDGRSDIYALGCTLYCLLTGQPPFRGPTLVELIQAKEVGTFPPARRVNPNVPERLDLIIYKMTAKYLSARYQTCAEVIRDLENLRIASPALGFVPAVRADMLSNPQEDSAIAEAPADTAEMDAPAKQPPDDDWYLRYRNRAGQLVTEKLPKEEIFVRAAEPSFDLSAKVSRHPDRDFEFLVSAREFRQRLLSRVTKAGSDARTAQYRSSYRELAKADSVRRQARQVPPPPTLEDHLARFRMPLLAALALGGLALLGYLLYAYILPGFAGAFLR